MANWSVLKTAVANIINTNGNQAITGQLLQNVLNNIITNVGENSTFAGIATVNTNPGAPDGPVFYLATTAGIYPNFNSLEVLEGEAVIFEWDNSTWSKKSTGFATQEKLTNLQKETDEKLSQLASKVLQSSITEIYMSDVMADESNELMSNINKSGYNIPELYGKKIYGFVYKSNIEGGTVRYGTATVNSNNVVSNFIEKSSFKTRLGFNCERIVPFVLNDNEAVYIQVENTITFYTNNKNHYNNSFINGIAENKANTSYGFSFAIISEPNSRQNIIEKRVKELEENTADDIPLRTNKTSINLNKEFSSMPDLRKIGNHFAVEGSVSMIELTSNRTGTISYGTAVIDEEGVVSDFVSIGNVNIDVIGVKNYEIPTIYLKKNQLVWLSGVCVSFANKSGYGESAPASYLENYQDNKLQSEFVVAYNLYVTPQETLGDWIQSVNNKLGIEEDSSKLYAALGDSITWGAYGGDEPDLPYIDENQSKIHGKSYADYLAELCGFNELQKLAISGNSIWANFLNQINRISGSPNLITFNFGVNDVTLIHQEENPIAQGNYVDVLGMNNTSPIDSASSELYNNSVIGRFRWCVEYLKTKYPNSTIVCLTPPNYRSDYNLEKQDTLKYIIEAETAICNYLGIKVVNIRKLGAAFESPSWDSFLHDLIHPEKIGYKMMAGAYWGAIGFKGV